MRHLKKFESFFNPSKVDTNKLMKHLDFEIGEQIVGIRIDSIDVNIKKRTLTSDILTITLKGPDKNITFEYLTNGRKIRKDYCMVKIGDQNWTLRKPASGGDFSSAAEEFVNSMLMRDAGILADIEGVDDIVMKYFGYRQSEVVDDDDYEDEPDYEEPDQDYEEPEEEE